MGETYASLHRQHGVSCIIAWRYWLGGVTNLQILQLSPIVKRCSTFFIWNRIPDG